MPDYPKAGTILLAGASRGLGLGLAETFLSRGWTVIATARTPEKSPGLAALHAAHGSRLRIETLDVTDPASATALAATLNGVTLDVLFVVAGVLTHRNTPVQDLPAADVAETFVTNATAPVALAEILLPHVKHAGTVAFMTSILGSIGLNSGGYDLYRASKAALNMLASCFALRHTAHPVLLLHPGWVRTEMGGPGAAIDVETSVTGLADVIMREHRAGIDYLDYTGKHLAW